MPKYAFKFISGKYQGGEFPIPDEGELLIGRATDLDLVLMEEMVSRKHARIVSSGGTITIQDLGSTNGTYVNGERIRKTELKKDDRLLIGTSILKVILGSEMNAEQRERNAPGLKDMMEDLATRQSSQTTTMSGELEEVPLPDLLQLFATNKKSGVLNISGAKRGKIYLKQGQMQYVTITGYNDMSGRKAFCRMVGWAKGTFQLEAYEEIKFPEIFQESTESMLMEAIRQSDELKRLLPEMPPLEAGIKISTPLVAKLSDLKPHELDIFQVILGQSKLKNILDKTATTDYDTMVVLQALLKRNYIEAT